MSVTFGSFYNEEGDVEVEAIEVREFGGGWSVNDEKRKT